MHKVEFLIEKMKEAAKRDRIVVKEDEEVYKVNIMTSAVAFVYEKLRTFIDYNEEHLLRKNAIYRIIKRRFIEKGVATKVSENIIKELISAGYLPNETIPDSMKYTVAEILTKYHMLFEEIQDRKGFFKKAVKMYRWLLSMAAAEIEEKLAPSNTEKVYIKFLYEEARKRFELDFPQLDEKTEDLYVFLAVNRSLIKSDRPMLNYQLLKLFYPKWKDDYEELIPYLAENIDEVKEQLEVPIDSKIVNKLIRKIRRYATMTNIFKQVMERRDIDHARLAEPEYLEERVREVTLKRYKEVRMKLRRSMTRAIVYIFLTKMLLALVIEVPLDYYFYGSVHYFSVFVNVTFPVLLLILIALSIRTPGEKNTDAMVEGIKSMLSADPVKVEYVRPEKKRSFFTRTLFNIIYVVAFALPFWLIITLLNTLNFSPFSIALFLVFLSIVSFFGVRIRHTAKELQVIEKKETFISELFNFFTMPIVRFGRWLSLNFSKVNVFAIFLDFFIEAPLKLFLQIMDDWFGFVKEKKEEY